MTERNAIVRLLVERFRRRPHFLTVPQTVQLIRRLVRNARPGPRDCVLWGRSRNNNGYGKLNLRLHGRHFQFYVHRLSHQLSQDPSDIPWYREIAHGCDTPPCFSPLCVARVRRTENRKASAENTNRKLARRRGEMREAA